MNSNYLSITYISLLCGALLLTFLSLASVVRAQVPSAHDLIVPLESQDIRIPTIETICNTYERVGGQTDVEFPTPQECFGEEPEEDPGNEDDNEDPEEEPTEEDTDQETDTGGGSSSGGGGTGSGGGSSSGGGGGGNSISGATGVSSVEIAECEPYLHEFIRFGEQNNPLEVLKLQQFLRDEEGFQNVLATGTYDQTTLVAVNAFQNRYAGEILGPWGIGQETGYVYLTTRKKINELHCDNTKSFELAAEEWAHIDAVRARALEAPPIDVAPETTEIGAVETSERLAEEPAEVDSDQVAAAAAVAESSLGRMFRGVGQFFDHLFGSMFE
jgi:hypothetical protein